MKRLFYYIFTVYAIILFIGVLLIVFPVYAIAFLIFPVKADKRLYPLTRLWGSSLPVLYFVRLVKHYDFKPEKGKQYIYIANHRSMFDIPVTARFIPSHFRFLAKKSLTRIPLFGLIIRGICIMVDRSSLTDKGRSFDKMKQTLMERSSVLIYPEGTRNKSGGDLGEFQNGAFRLALETGTPIIILTLWSTSQILLKDKFWQLRPGKVDCYVSGPVEPGNETISSLKAKCEKIVLHNIALSKNDAN